MHGLDDVLTGGEALGHVLAADTVANGVEEGANDGELDVGFEESAAHVGEGLFEVRVREAPT
jgi:hypothetical protein